jgi:hypothetical protein
MFQKKCYFKEAAPSPGLSLSPAGCSRTGWLSAHAFWRRLLRAANLAHPHTIATTNTTAMAKTATADVPLIQGSSWL